MNMGIQPSICGIQLPEVPDGEKIFTMYAGRPVRFTSLEKGSGFSVCFADQPEEESYRGVGGSYVDDRGYLWRGT